MRVLSLCTGAGLMDRAFADAGFEIVAGCEIDPRMRAMYNELCGDAHLCHDIMDLPALVAGQHFNGIIGGPPCQANSKTRAMRVPKFQDLTQYVRRVMEAASCDFFLFENVGPLDIPGAVHTRLDAMHFSAPHQSRPRWFTHSPNVAPPPRAVRGHRE